MKNPEQHKPEEIEKEIFSKETEKFISEKESENQLLKDVKERRRLQEEKKKNNKEKPATPTKSEKSDKEKVEDLSSEIKETGVFEEFNVSFEELEQIPGFEKLSHGQRLLVAENLKQITLGRVHEEASDKHKEKTANAGFLGRVWKGVSKKYQIAKLEKATAKDIISGGIEVHEKALIHLIERAGDGPDVEVTKDGKLEVLYASSVEDLNPKQKESFEEFNKLASKFSKLPEEWRTETASKKEQEEYKAMREQYEKAKIGILDIKRDKSGYKEAALYVNDIDSRVYGDQFLNTHPEVEEQLQNITDKSIWTRAMANVATERGLYFAGGFITRTLTTSLLGLAGAPLTAAGMGGFMARKRAKEALVEHEKGARRGEEDKSKEAKNFVNVDSMREKLEKLSERISNEEDHEKKEKLLISLRARISYTQRKMEDGLINYGKGTERFASQYELVSSLSSAVVYTGAGRTGKSELGLRLDDSLNFKEQKISKAQEKYVRDQMIRGAVMGAGFAVAGYALRHFGEEWFGWGEKVSPKVKGSDSLNQNLTEGELKTKVEDFTGVEKNIHNLTLEIQNTPEYVVQHGDNIWKIIENKLKAHDIFRGLEEGQRTHLIDELKDKVSAMSQEELKDFGVSSGDTDIIHAGESLDFSKIINTESINKGISNAETLTDTQIASIEANNIKIADWAEAHPDSAITSERIDTILGSEGHVGVGNVEATDLTEAHSHTSSHEDEVNTVESGGVEKIKVVSEDAFTWKFMQGQEDFLKNTGKNVHDELFKLYEYDDQMIGHKWPSIVNEKIEDVMSVNREISKDPLGFASYGFSKEDIINKTQEYIQSLSDKSGINPLPDEKVIHYIERVIGYQGNIVDSYEGLAKKMMSDKIESIYEYGFSFFKGSQIEEWNGSIMDGVVGIKDMKVSDILKGDFGIPPKGSFSIAYSNNQKQLLDFLYELRESVEPRGGETTRDYIERALQDKITPDDFEEYLLGLGAEITYK